MQEVKVGSTRRRLPADFLMDPVVVVALAVLLVNDHVLKGQFGNWWTGKLSDVAGLVLFPVLLVALFESARRTFARSEWAVGVSAFWRAAWLTAMTFTIIKTVPAATVAAESLNHVAATPLRALGLVDGVTVRQDPSDLLAVPFVLLAVWVGYRWRQEPPRAIPSGRRSTPHT